MSNNVESPGASPIDHDYFNLGTYHRPITTKNSNAQIWFDRGLIWSYAFNHEEAVSCFERSISYDENCAMAFWGLAYSLGPNYNKPWEAFDHEELVANVKNIRDAATQASLYAGRNGGASTVERAIIQALQFRCPTEKTNLEDFDIWNCSYAEEMGKVYREFPEDFDVAALYADALMNLTPWQMWDLSTGEPAAGARTLEAKEVLDRALDFPGGLRHPGLLHLYIHLMEMSSAPEAALPVANHLRGLVPDAGHLNHMPTHLDMLCGDYQKAITSNTDAIRADEKFLARRGPLNFYTLYRSHDYHFRIYAAMFAGQYQIALETVALLEASIPEALLRVESPPMADWLEGFLTSRVHVLVRFGRWQDIIDLAIPHDETLWCVTTAVLYYGKGIAFAATGAIEKADEQHTLFLKFKQRVPSSRTLFNNKCIDILAVAAAMLDGELEYRRGNHDVGLAHLQRAIRIDDALPYDEPWGWMQPTRHAYGALLLEQNKIEEAAAVYSADLGIDGTLPRALQHPNNVWSLHGYHECLVKLGRTIEATVIGDQLKKAVEGADIPIKSSCFCRLK